MELHAKNSSAVRGGRERSAVVGARNFAFGIHGIGVDEIKGRAVRNPFEQWRTAAPGCPHPIPSDLRHGERTLESPHFAAKQTKARRRSHLVRKVEKQLMADAKLPTPGRTILSATAMTSASRVTRRSAPACRSARAMLATLATGESMR